MPLGDYLQRCDYRTSRARCTLAQVKENYPWRDIVRSATRCIPCRSGWRWLVWQPLMCSIWWHQTFPQLWIRTLGSLRRILDNKYGFDDFNQAVFAGGQCFLGSQLWKVGDQAIIDGALVNGSAKGVGLFPALSRSSNRLSVSLRVRHDHRPVGSDDRISLFNLIACMNATDLS